MHSSYRRTWLAAPHSLSLETRAHALRRGRTCARFARRVIIHRRRCSSQSGIRLPWRGGGYPAWCEFIRDLFSPAICRSPPAAYAKAVKRRDASQYHRRGQCRSSRRRRFYDQSRSTIFKSHLSGAARRSPSHDRKEKKRRMVTALCNSCRA